MILPDHPLEIVDRYARRFDLPPMAPHLLEPCDLRTLAKHMRRALKTGQPVPSEILEPFVIPDGAAS